MSSGSRLSSRLARLAARDAATSEEPARAVAKAPANTSPLEALRARMDAMLAREPSSFRAPERTVPQTTETELPFVVEQTPKGPLHVRTLRYGSSHRMGRITVADARRANPELLALFALDPRLGPCDVARALYLDTETTGLGSGAGTVAFLVGLAWFEEESDGTPPSFVVEQLLVRQLGEEAPVLARVRERIAAASMLVTFNGKSFDLPVLRARFVMAQMPAPEEPPHLDVLHVARRIHKARGTGTTLGALEREVLGFVREGDVPSSEVATRYLYFLRTGDPSGMHGVIEHNAWDVVAMAALVGLYGEALDESQLAPRDLIGAARTLGRAGSSDLAYAVAEAAVAKGAGSDAVRVRAELAKARGDKARALSDFEALAASVKDPSLLLELAKLHEHHTKDLRRALALVEAGTSEPEPKHLKRRARLERKLDKQTNGPPK